MATASIAFSAALNSPLQGSHIGKKELCGSPLIALQLHAFDGSVSSSISYNHMTSASLRFYKSPRRSPIRASVDGSILIRSVPVLVACELLEAGHKYLDVRTAEEFESGHVEGAVNIPYLIKHAGGMTKNPNFIKQVLETFDKDDEIVVACQSGKRSLMAVKELNAAEFTGVTDMGGGFLAWSQSGLPVTKA